MKKLTKCNSSVNSVEAYACSNCIFCDGCGCACNIITGPSGNSSALVEVHNRRVQENYRK